MSTQNVYFTNPATLTSIQTGTNFLVAGRPYGFQSQNIQSVQPYVPDYEWDVRVRTAKVSRSLAQFVSKEAMATTNCSANHVSARIPTGYRVAGGPVTVGVQPFKYTTVPSPYDTQGLSAPSLGGALSPTGGTQDLRDLDPATLNPWIVMSPLGCYMDECTASSLIRININTGAAGGPAVGSSINYVLPAQQYFATISNGVAGGVAVHHIPIYRNDPRCNSVIHVHGVAEVMSAYKKGYYPFGLGSEFSAVYTDYLEWPGIFWGDGGPGGDVASLVAQNYVNFRNECTRVGQAPLSNLSLSINDTGGATPGAVTLNVPNWESKFIIVAKQHGANIWSDNVQNLQLYVPFNLKSFGNAITIEGVKENCFTLTNLNTGSHTGTLRFMSPEAQTYLSTTGGAASFRQQTIVVTTGTNAPFTLNYDGTIHSFLRAQQLDAWYKGNTGATGTAAYDVSLWGAADIATQTAYNAFVASGVDFVGTVSNGTTILNTVRLFTDAWSSPAVRLNSQNPLYIEDTFAIKGGGDSVLQFAMPGYDL